MHEGREESSSGGARWGSGEAVIENVELIGRDGRPTFDVHTGDPIVVRMHYRAHEPIPQPVFGLAVHTVEGVHVTAPNSLEAGVVPDKIHGAGVVDVTIDRLLLLKGTYDLSVALADHAVLHTYDFRQRVLRFDVSPGEPQETFGGVVSLGGQWSIQPGE